MNYDVIVSGAGPAGSKCAEVVAKAGYKVALIEKDVNWRKPCAGEVSNRIFKYYPQIKKLNPLKHDGFVIHSSNYSKLECKLDDIFIVIDRMELDNLIRDVAVDAGAELFDKNMSYDFTYNNQYKTGIKTRIPTGKKEYKGKIIVIADGMSSKLAPKSGIRGKWNYQNIIKCIAVTMEGKSNLDPTKVYVFWQKFEGYGWIFPIDENHFNIGIGHNEEDYKKYTLSKIYNDFLNNENVKKLIPDSNYKTIWSAAYPLPAHGVLEKSLYSDNLMIIGDAAGFVSPISGEGIHSGIVSGNIAGETAVKALEQEEYSAKQLKIYKFHPNIKKIIRNFKMKRNLVNFFFEKGGANINRMFEMAANDKNYKQQLIDIFINNATPSKEFIDKIRG